MGFWSTLTALFAKDAVDAYTDTKKEIAAQKEKNHGFLYEWEYMDDESYKTHSPECVKYTNLMMEMIDEILEASEYSADKKNLIRRTISAFPYYAVLIEQGGGVHEVQERFLKNIKKAETSYSGAEIKAAANDTSSAIALEIEENGKLVENVVGRAWDDLLSVTGAGVQSTQSKLQTAVGYLALVSVHFAQMADVIVEQLLKEDIERTFSSHIC